MIEEKTSEVRLADATIDWDRLQDPFPDQDLEWRVQKAGWDRNGGPWALVVPYVTSRAIMDRLDTVVGPDRWVSSFRQWQAAKDGCPAVTCGISILVRGEWITKWDGAPETNIEPTKGGFSDSLKRAAVHWGIGRWLYTLEATFADTQAEQPRPERRRYWKKSSALVDRRDKNSFRDFWWKIPLLGQSRPHGERANEPEERRPVQRMVDWIRGLATLRDAARARGQIAESEKYAALDRSDKQRVWYCLLLASIRLSQSSDELDPGIKDLLKKDKTEGNISSVQFDELSIELDSKLGSFSS